MTGDLDEDERAELLRLRAEITVLRATRPRRWTPHWRAVVALVLVLVGCVLASVSLVSVWAHDEVTDTDRFAATVDPLVGQPSVQTLVTDRVTDTIFTYVDVQRTAQQAVAALQARGLPAPVADRLDDLTGPLETSLRGFVHGQIGKLVAGPGFAALWDRVVRAAHEQTLKVLTDNSSAIGVSQGKVVLDLGPVVDAAKQRLVAAGFGVAKAIPTVHPTIVLTDATTLLKARSAYRLLDAVATWLPWLTGIVLAAGILVVRQRRRTLCAAGIGFAASMLVLAVGLLVARNVFVNAVAADASVAAEDSFDIVVNFLRVGLRSAFVVGLAVALGAFLAGPGPTATRTRRAATTSIDWVRAHTWRRERSAVDDWVHGHGSALRIGVVALVVLVFVFVDQPTVTTVLVLVIALCVGLAVIQYFDRPRLN